MKQTKSEFLQYLSLPGTTSKNRKKESDPLKDFYTSLLYRSATVASHGTSTKGGVKIGAEDVRYAATMLGFDVSSVLVEEVTPTGEFVLMTETILESKLPYETVPQSEALDLLYIIYKGVEIGSVVVTDISSDEDWEEAMGNFPVKHYALSSPVGVQAQFFQRDLEFETMDEEYTPDHVDDEDEVLVVDGDEENADEKKLIVNMDAVIDMGALEEGEIVIEDDADLMDMNVL